MIYKLSVFFLVSHSVPKITLFVCWFLFVCHDFTVQTRTQEHRQKIRDYGYRWSTILKANQPAKTLLEFLKGEFLININNIVTVYTKQNYKRSHIEHHHV